MKIKLRDLKSIVRETKKEKKSKKDQDEIDIKDKDKDLLLAKDTITEAKTHLSEISVDDQIDALLIGFEEDSVNIDKYKTKYESKSLTQYAKMMLEQEDDEEDAEDEKLGKSGVETSKEIDAEWPANPETPNMDINQFASKVARLLVNRENLLDVRTVIFNRADRFIKENYGKETAIKLGEILENEHGIEKERDYHPKTPQHYAVGAGPAIGG